MKNKYYDFILSRFNPIVKRYKSKERNISRLDLLKEYIEVVGKKVVGEKEYSVLNERIDKSATTRDIANKLKVSKSRVYQIENKAIRKLMHPKYTNKFYLFKMLELYCENNEEAISMFEALLKKRAVEKVEDYKKNLDRNLECLIGTGKIFMKSAEFLNLPIEKLGLSSRPYNSCKSYGRINTIKDLTEKTEKELLSYRCIGEKSIREIKEKLESVGLSLFNIPLSNI